MKKTVEKLFKRFAQKVTVFSDELHPGYAVTYGFIQPLRYKNKMYVDTQFHELGLDDDGRFVYIGMPEMLLTGSAGNRRSIEVGNYVYSVIRAENVMYKGEALYVWAIIKKDRDGNYV